MRKFLVLLVLIAMSAGMLLLTGCDSRDSDLVGTWQWDDNPAFVSVFNEDGTGSHALDWGFGTTFRWSTPGNRIVWNYPDHPNVYTNYSISGDVLNITMDDGTVLRYIRIP